MDAEEMRNIARCRLGSAYLAHVLAKEERPIYNETEVVAAIDVALSAQASRVESLTEENMKLRRCLVPKVYKACQKHEGQQVWNLKATIGHQFVETVCPICSGDAT